MSASDRTLAIGSERRTDTTPIGSRVFVDEHPELGLTGIAGLTLLLRPTAAVSGPQVLTGAGQITTYSGNGTSHAIPVPTGGAQDDVLVIVLAKIAGDTPTIPAGSGIAAIANATSFLTSSKLRAYRKVLSATAEPASYTWTTATDKVIAYSFLVRGLNPADPENIALDLQTTGAEGFLARPPSVLPDVARTFVLRMGHTKRGTKWSAPAGVTPLITPPAAGSDLRSGDTADETSLFVGYEQIATEANVAVPSRDITDLNPFGHTSSLHGGITVALNPLGGTTEAPSAPATPGTPAVVGGESKLSVSGYGTTGTGPLRYRIYVKTASAVDFPVEPTLETTQTTAIIEPLVPESYVVRVEAVDSGDRVSTVSATSASATVVDTAPSVPSVLVELRREPYDPDVPGSQQGTHHVFGPPNPEPDVVSYEVLNNNVVIGTTPHDGDGWDFYFTPGGPFSITAKAVDAAGNKSAASGTVVSDTSPVTPIQGFRAVSNAAGNGGTLFWRPSPAHEQVTTYKIAVRAPTSFDSNGQPVYGAYPAPFYTGPGTVAPNGELMLVVTGLVKGTRYLFQIDPDQ